MKKPVKVLLWVVGFLVLLLVGATVALKLYLTKDRILAWVIPPLEESLQRKVAIADAGAGLTGIHLDGLDVRAEGAQVPLVSAGTIRVRWDLLALLSGKVSIKEVRLVEPRIHVVRRADGSLDIDDLLTPGETVPEAPSEPEAAEPTGTPGAPLQVAVAIFSMENGRVAFEDRTQSPPRTYALDAIESKVTDVSLEHPFPYELSARLPLAEAGRFSLAGTVNPASQDVSARIQVKDFDLPSLNPLMEGGIQFASGVLGIDLDADVAAGTRADVKGSVGLMKLTLSAADKTGQSTDITIEIDAGADLTAGTAVLRGLDLTAADQSVHVEGKARGLMERPRVDFTVESAELRADALGTILPPTEEAKAEPEKPPPAGAREAASVPIDAFGDVRVGKLLAGGVAIEDFTARIELEKGVLTVKPAQASIYGGKLNLAARAELEREEPPFDATVEISGTQLGDLIAGLSPKLKDTMTGTLGLSVKADGRGGDLAALRSKINAEAKDGKIVNHPLVMQFAQLFQVKELEKLNFYSLRADMETAEGLGKVNALVFNGPNLQATGKGTVGLLDNTVDMRLAVALPKEIASKLIKEANTLKAVTDEEGWTRLAMDLKGSLDNPSYRLDAKALAAAATKALGGEAEKLVEEKVLKKVPVTEEQKGLLEGGMKKLFGQ